MRLPIFASARKELERARRDLARYGRVTYCDSRGNFVAASQIAVDDLDSGYDFKSDVARLLRDYLNFPKHSSNAETKKKLDLSGLPASYQNLIRRLSNMGVENITDSEIETFLQETLKKRDREMAGTPCKEESSESQANGKRDAEEKKRQEPKDEKAANESRSFKKADEKEEPKTPNGESENDDAANKPNRPYASLVEDFARRVEKIERTKTNPTSSPLENNAKDDEESDFGFDDFECNATRKSKHDISCDDKVYDEDDYVEQTVDYQQKIERQKNRAAREYLESDKLSELYEIAKNAPRYSFQWFKTLLTLEERASRENLSGT